LQQYSDGYKRWESLTKPYQNLFTQHNVDPVQVMQALMNSHLQLAQASPAEKRALASKMLKAYGLDIDTPQEPNSELTYLREQLDSLRSTVTASQRAQAESAHQAALKTVEAFGADPANKYFDEVAGDIPRFLPNAKDLKEAYELACFANPVIRQKMQAEQLAQSAPATPAKRFPNLNANGSPVPRQQRKGSMDDTINEVVSKHFPAH